MSQPNCTAACSLDGLPHIYFYLRTGKYGWLSNFYRARQTVQGFEYPTNEHYFQAAKARAPDVAQWIRQAPDPFLAKMAGRSLREHERIPNWEQVKFETMKNGLRAKFSQNADLKEKLLATENAVLHEDSPTDMIWGAKGKDMLGKLLMQIREELRTLE